MKILTYFSIFLLLPVFGLAQEVEVKPEMILVEGGKFMMGNDYSHNEDERPQRIVTIKSFNMAKYEVTNEQYKLFCENASIEHPDPDPLHAKQVVTNVSWFYAVMYCNWLSDRELLDKSYIIRRDSTEKMSAEFIPGKNGYRLPTEAEWEFAARGGTKTKHYSYSGGNVVGDIAWEIPNANNTPHEPGKKKANELGIFDMTGNALEWCSDWYSANYYSKKENTDPTGPKEGVDRVCRGGNYLCKRDVLRSTKRFSLGPNDDTGIAGIRIAQNQ